MIAVFFGQVELDQIGVGRPEFTQVALQHNLIAASRLQRLLYSGSAFLALLGWWIVADAFILL